MSTTGVEWVRVNKLAEMTGYSQKALESKIAQGVFTEGVHFVHSEDRRIHFNLEAYNRWVAGIPTTPLVASKALKRTAGASA